MKKRTTILTALTLSTILLAGCATTTARIERIDLEAAKAFAIEAAELTADEVSGISIELDKRNGIEFYDVEFSANGKKYDYDVDALTGAIIGVESKQVSKKASEIPVEELTLKLEETSAAPTPAPKEEKKAADNIISEEKAKEIALSEVPGATESDIRGFRVDRDDGRIEYEGSIYYDELEYEFEIDGYSGAIRDWDVESIYD
jgi:uncharacterized membrane protein YkoI